MTTTAITHTDTSPGTKINTTAVWTREHTIDWAAFSADLGANLAQGTLKMPYSFLIYKSGSDYYATDGSKTVYGGADDAGSVDGADFSAVFNACMVAVNAAGGGSIFLTAGSFTATSQLTLLSRVNVVGAGIQLTIINFDDTFTCFKSEGVLGGVKTCIQLCNFTVAGTNTGTAGVGIELNYTYSNTTIDNVSVKNVGGVGVKLTACYAINISWIEVSECNDFGLLVYSSHGALINAHVYDCGLSAPNNPNIALYDCSRTEIKGTCEGWHSTLLLINSYLGGVPEVNRVSMYFEGSGRVQVSGGRKIVFDACRFLASTTGGGSATRGLVLAGNTTSTSIINCLFRGFTTSNVWISEATVLRTELRDCENFDGLFLDDDGTDTQYDNIYDVTGGTPLNEESGTATITDGNTYVEFTHTIYQPDASWFTITPLSPPRGMTHWWLVRWSETTSRIYIDAAVNPEGQIYKWRIRRPRF